MVVAGIAWKWLYAENGLLNQLLASVNISPTGIPWLTSPEKLLNIVPISLMSVMLVTIWKGLGYYMVIYLAGLQSIPDDVYEAAAIDGSDGIRKHWDITIPLMKPYLALVAVISAISATKVFEEVFVMTQGGPLNSSKTIVYYLYEQAFSNLEISYACTIGLVLFLMILALSALRLFLNQQQDMGI
jgi:putative chitobiose transport system permease protein